LPCFALFRSCSNDACRPSPHLALTLNNIQPEQSSAQQQQQRQQQQQQQGHLTEEAGGSFQRESLQSRPDLAWKERLRARAGRSDGSSSNGTDFSQQKEVGAALIDEDGTSNAGDSCQQSTSSVAPGGKKRPLFEKLD
jgi:hypothetical protein